ncbi:MAG: hypothetical protein IIW35_00750 [Bacteroidaceae bacterium]|nr:hypothetical protein [Bacteroidaceae bacterium]MBQ5816863.1 hypothetical protein [Bacteroidaceae bacterium]
MTSNVDVKKIIDENNERLKRNSAVYNPVTGEGSTSLERRWVEIEGFPLTRMNLPVEMLGDRLVEELSQKGAHRFLEARGNKIVSHRNIITLWLEFCRKRIKYDFEYWAKTMAVISDKGRGRDIPFTLNRPQRFYLSEMEKLRLSGRPIDIILCKARQWGGSTLTQLYMLWIQLVHKRNWNSVICGDVEKQSSIVAGIMAKVINNYPLWATGGKKLTTTPYQGTQKTRTISWSNSRYSLGSSQKPDSLRSEDISMAHLTEVGLWKATAGRKPEDLVQSIFGSIAAGPYTVKVMESTAKGVGNFFHRTWMNATAGHNNFTPVFVPWYIIDLYSKQLPPADYPAFIESMDEYEHQLFTLGATLEAIAWYRDKRREMPEEWRLFSEFPSTANEAFQSTGRRVFKISYVKNIRECCVPPAWIGDIVSYEKYDEATRSNKSVTSFEPLQPGEPSNENVLKVWLMPDTELNCRDRYIVTVDVGGVSDKADYSCILVADRLPMLEGGVPEIAACWHGHIEHDKLAWKAVEIAKAYNNALLVIESNTLETEGTEGDNFEYILNEIAGKYSNLYSRTSSQEIRQGRPRRWGFHTNPSTKPMVINFLIKAIRDGLYVEHCIETTYELDLYELKENGKEMGAVEGNHDDRVMATAILVWICYNHPLPTIVATEKTVKNKTRIVSEASI